MQEELPLPPTATDLSLSRVTTIRCMYCDKQVPQPFWVNKHFGRSTNQFPFCGEHHANLYYLKRLRDSN